jgi:hypothetical protein
LIDLSLIDEGEVFNLKFVPVEKFKGRFLGAIIGNLLWDTLLARVFHHQEFFIDL